MHLGDYVAFFTEANGTRGALLCDCDKNEGMAFVLVLENSSFELQAVLKDLRLETLGRLALAAYDEHDEAQLFRDLVVKGQLRPTSSLTRSRFVRVEFYEKVRPRRRGSQPQRSGRLSPTRSSSERGSAADECARPAPQWSKRPAKPRSARSGSGDSPRSRREPRRPEEGHWSRARWDTS